MKYGFTDNAYDQETINETVDELDEALKNIVPHVFWSDKPKVLAARDALNKQVPQGAVKSNVFGMFLCPSCGTSISPGGRYCCYCGQKIEWA